MDLLAGTPSWPTSPGAAAHHLKAFKLATFLREYDKEQADLFNELQRRSTSPECAVRYFEAVGNFDITDLLAKVWSCTCVGICKILSKPAARWPLALRARFVALQGQNHILLSGEPAAARFQDELRLFLAQ